MRAFAAAAVVLASSASASAAWAVEREQHLGVDVGGGLLVIGNKSTSDLGASAMAHYTYGLNDAFNLMVEGGYSLVALGQTADSPRTPQTYPAWIANADVGIGYVFDVLTWVPYDEAPAGRRDRARPRLPGGTVRRHRRRGTPASPVRDRHVSELHAALRANRVRVGLVSPLEIRRRSSLVV
jgi:hypothetical protein